MDRNDCIKHCRYYTGSAENTFSDNESFFWFWEKKWVEFSEVAYSSNSDSEPLHIMMSWHLITIYMVVECQFVNCNE